MNIEEFIIEVYCFIDDEYKNTTKNLKIRTRGFKPGLTDSEVITMEIIGEYLGYNRDTRIWKYFKNNMLHLFPKISSRCNFVKQAANLWHIKQLLQERIIQKYFKPSDLHIIDGFPMPICRYVRASRCKSFKGIADYGYCAAKDEKYYGFKGHIVVDSNGVITAFTAASPEVDERVALYDICTNIKGLLLGDKGYIKKELSMELLDHGINLQSPMRKNMQDDRSKWFLKFMRSKRKIIETVISQLTMIFNIQSIRVRDIWHLTNRFTRKILAHNICTLINFKHGFNILHIEPIVS